MGGLAARHRRTADHGVAHHAGAHREHTEHSEWLLEQHEPDEATVRLSLTDDVFLRSSTWARVQLGIPLPVEDYTLAAASTATVGTCGSIWRLARGACDVGRGEATYRRDPPDLRGSAARHPYHPPRGASYTHPLTGCLYSRWC